MAENLGEARLRLTADSSKLDAAMKRASANMRKVGLGMVAFGAAIGAPLAAGVKIFAEYEQSMAQVQAVSGATAEEFAALDKIAREMGRTTVFTARESAQALAFMSMAGLEAEESIAALPDVLNLAAAGQLELAESADIVTNVMAGYGIAADDVTSAVDVLTKGFTSANTDLVQLGEAFKYGGPVAKAAGLEFEETAAALALMGNAGFQGTLAGTALRGAIVRMLNPTDEAAGIMEKYGVEVLDATGNMNPLVDILGKFEAGGITAADAMALFGQRAGPGMLALIGQGTEALADLTLEMEEAGGTAQRIADTQLDTLQGKWTLLKSAVEGLALSVGQVLVPILTDLAEKVAPIIQRVIEWSEKNPELTRTIVLVGAAVAALSLGLGTLLMAASVLIPVLAAVSLPVLAIGAAIAALIAGIGLLIVNWDKIKPHFQPLIDWWNDTLIPAFRELAEYAWPLIKQVWENDLKPTFDTLMVTIRSVIDQWSDTLIPVFKNLAEYVWPLIKEAWENDLKPTFEELIVTIGHVMGRVRDWITRLGELLYEFKKVFDHYLLPVLLPLVKAAFEGISLAISVAFGLIRILLAGLRGDFDRVWREIVGIVTGAIDKIFRMIERVKEAWSSISFNVPQVNQVGSVIGSIGGIISNIPNIPGFAEGGIVHSPTLAMLGERGPEAIVPLGRGAGGGGTTIAITVEGNVLDGEDFAERIMDVLRKRGDQGLLGGLV